MRCIYGQGGGWLGRFSLPIWQHLFDTEGHADEYAGTSVSALHASLAGQGDLARAEQLWDGIDDGCPWDGIEGFTGLALRRGLWNMRGLDKKIRSLLRLEAIERPVHVGVCSREPFEHHTLCSKQARSARQWESWVSASARIAFVFQPIDVRLPDGRLISGRDGGHLYSVPPCPELRPGDRIDVLLHHPLDAAASEVPHLGHNELIGELRWLLWVHFATGHWEALRRFHALAETGVDVRLWAPAVSLGEMLDARKETLDRRHNLGIEAIRRGPVRLGQ